MTMNRAIAARLAELEASMRYERAACEQQTVQRPPADAAERRRLYAELTAPSGERPAELRGLSPTELVDAYRRLIGGSRCR
jgi:hypothetical protein